MFTPTTEKAERAYAAKGGGRKNVACATVQTRIRVAWIVDGGTRVATDTGEPSRTSASESSLIQVT